MDDYFFSCEPEEYYRWLNKNIEDVFGKTYKDEDFYKFIKGAFNGQFEKENKYLKRFGKEEIVVDKKTEITSTESHSTERQSNVD